MSNAYSQGEPDDYVQDDPPPSKPEKDERGFFEKLFSSSKDSPKESSDGKRTGGSVKDSGYSQGYHFD